MYNYKVINKYHLKSYHTKKMICLKSNTKLLVCSHQVLYCSHTSWTFQPVILNQRQYFRDHVLADLEVFPDSIECQRELPCYSRLDRSLTDGPRQKLRSFAFTKRVSAKDLACILNPSCWKTSSIKLIRVFLHVKRTEKPQSLLRKSLAKHHSF